MGLRIRTVLESVMLCGHQGLGLRGERDGNNTENLNWIVNLIVNFNTVEHL